MGSPISFPFSFSQVVKSVSLVASWAIGASMIANGQTELGAGVITAAMSSANLSK